MKKLLMGIGATILFAGFIAGTSFAGQRKPVDVLAEQRQDEDNAVWVEWRADLSASLKTDEEYITAAERLRAFDGEDEEEHARLQTALDDSYYEIALPIYEKHFGTWEGDHDEFFALLAADNQAAIIRICHESARETCGSGNVKTVTVTADGGCTVECFAQTPATP